MYKIIYESFFNDKYYNQQKQLRYAVAFFICTIPVLGLDSVAFTRHYFDGRQITNLLTIVFFFLFFSVSNSHLRKLMFTMVFLSYIGELTFCKLVGMYNYRTEFIPLYVPFGHAIVYASGYVFSETFWAVKNELQVRKFFAWFFTLLFLSVGIFRNDVFSLLFGIPFFILLRRKKWNNLYYFIALCVIFIELVGTFFECWTWIPKTFGVIPTANPPMGAVFFYAGGDVLLVKIVSCWENNKKIDL